MFGCVLQPFDLWHPILETFEDSQDWDKLPKLHWEKKMREQ